MTVTTFLPLPFHQNQFVQQPEGPAMRSPVQYHIAHTDQDLNLITNYHVLNWHNESPAGIHAELGVNILANIFNNHGVPENAIVVGDFNRTGVEVMAVNPFNSVDHNTGMNLWNDLVADNFTLDHILTQLANVENLGDQGGPLDFVSDPYHYPIASLIN